MTPLLVLPLVLLTGAASAHGQPPPQSPVRTIDAAYSFTREPFVDPRILYEMQTWTSGLGDLVVEIDLSSIDDRDWSSSWTEIKITESIWPDGWFGTLPASKSRDPGESANCPFVSATEKDGHGYFGYGYVGMTDFGAHVLFTSESGGGSGTWTGLMLLASEFRQGIEHDEKRNGRGVVRAGHRRVVLRKLGTIRLGDRWGGEIRIRGNSLFIGRDEGWFSSHPDYTGRQVERTLTVDIRSTAPLVLAGDEVPCRDRQPSDESRPRADPRR